MFNSLLRQHYVINLLHAEGLFIKMDTTVGGFRIKVVALLEKAEFDS